jgi:uncharacterized C2H2 Zn-finger protein
MTPVQCAQCGKEFKNDLAMKIHVGRQHGSKAKAKAKTKSASKKVAPAGNTTCDICGRTFALPLHLGRHVAATHGKGKAPKAAKPAKRGRRAARAVAAPARIVGAADAEVRTLTVDQLIALKEAVDGRLAEIVRFMRQAKVNI